MSCLGFSVWAFAGPGMEAVLFLNAVAFFGGLGPLKV